METSDDAKCPKCQDTLIQGKSFCANCGLPILDPAARSLVDAYTEARVRLAVEARMGDKGILTRKVAYDAEDIVRKRIGRHSWFAALILFLLGVAGFNSIKEAKTTIVEEARNRLTPVLSDVESRVRAAQFSIGNANRAIAIVKGDLDETSKLAQTQRARLDEQSGDVTEKLKEVQSSYERAQQLSKEFEKQSVLLQAAYLRLETMQKQLGSRIDRVADLANRTAIQQAYPKLGQKLYLTLNGQPWAGTTGKPASVRWVNINLSPASLADKNITPEAVKSLADQLEKRNYTPVVGAINTEGAVSAGYGCFMGSKEGVYYLGQSHASEAVDVANLVSQTLHLKLSTYPAQAWEGQGAAYRLVFDKSGIDIQVCINRIN